MAEVVETKCSRCGSTTHEARRCYAPFARSWMGKCAIKATLRSATGRTIDVMRDLTEAEMLAICAVLNPPPVPAPTMPTEPEHNHFGEVFAPGTCPACAAMSLPKVPA